MERPNRLPGNAVRGRLIGVCPFLYIDRKDMLVRLDGNALTVSETELPHSILEKRIPDKPE